MKILCQKSITKLKCLSGVCYRNSDKINKVLKTVVIGASENPQRYANLAVRSLQKKGHDVIAIGNKTGNINGIDILKGKPTLSEVDTITLYINPTIQKDYYDYLLSLRPRRIIFNPGTENQELQTLAHENQIITEEACTLVLLNLGQY